MKKLLLALVAFSCSSMVFAIYTPADRFKLMEDKYKTYDFLNNDEDHLHIINLGVGVNFDILNLISDIGSATDPAGAQAFTAKWDGSEHFLRFDVGFKVPLFGFEAWGVEVKPTIDLGASGGVLIGVTSEIFGVASLANYVSGIPQVIVDCLDEVTEADLAATTPPRDIIRAAESRCSIPTVVTSPYYDKFIAPDIGLAPVIGVMTKGDLKGGINFKFKKGGFFGRTGLNAVFRTDFSAKISEGTLSSPDGLMSLLTGVNLHGFLMGNLTAGYRIKMFSIQGGMEEIKIAQAVDKSEESGELSYGTPVLFRLHSQADFTFASFSLRPFAGFSTRSGYTIMQGIYAGADFGIHFMNKRFGMGLRGMFDQHHITLGIQPRLGVIQLNAMGKIPVASSVDGVKPPTIVSVGLSVFI